MIIFLRKTETADFVYYLYTIRLTITPIIMSLYEEIAAMIDHSLLKPTLTEEAVIEGCRIADEYKVASVCVRPCDVLLAAEILQDSPVLVTTVIGFPHGTTTTQAKLEEAKEYYSKSISTARAEEIVPPALASVFIAMADIDLQEDDKDGAVGNLHRALLVDPTREQALVLRSQAGLVVLTGCGQPNIASILQNILKHLGGPIDIVIGGLHLACRMEDEVLEAVKTFRSLGMKRTGLCHCTGEEAMQMFRDEYGDDFIEVGAGLTLQT